MKMDDCFLRRNNLLQSYMTHSLIADCDKDVYRQEIQQIQTQICLFQIFGTFYCLLSSSYIPNLILHPRKSILSSRPAEETYMRNICFDSQIFWTRSKLRTHNLISCLSVCQTSLRKSKVIGAYTMLKKQNTGKRKPEIVELAIEFCLMLWRLN